ncbi:GNAT family N-acetyltransferase [Leptolyngbya sp. AN02str]|uniref:GNAT family N-acetyltransferase n=1 Tax=Leptolyngbya sp. AN02str TaxID=3423363 RepID=UPI003D315C10
MNHSIRDAVALDRPQLVKLMAQLQNYERSLHPNRSDGRVIASAHFGYLEELVVQHQGRIFVADADGTIWGFLVCLVEHLDPDDLHIINSDKRFGVVSDLYIDEAARSRGIAKALLLAAEQHFKSLGLSTVRITTLYNNAIARLAYEQLDYQPYEVTYERRLT